MWFWLEKASAWKWTNHVLHLMLLIQVFSKANEGKKKCALKKVPSKNEIYFQQSKSQIIHWVFCFCSIIRIFWICEFIGIHPDWCYFFNFSFEYEDTICKASSRYKNPKFTSGDLRETMKDDQLAELFQAILDADRIAQNHRCFYSPCGSISVGIPGNSTNPDGPDNGAVTKYSINYLAFLLLIINLIF